MSTTFKRTARVLATGAAIAFAGLAGSGEALAVSAPIHIAGTGGDGVNIRPTPDTSGASRGRIPEGASPDYNCYAYGASVNGVSVWFSVNYAGATGYYSSFYDDSSYQSEAELESKYGVPKCGAPAQPAPAEPSGALQYGVYNADGGIYYRSSPRWSDTPSTAGVGVYNGDRLQLICGAFGDPVGPGNNTAWSYVKNLTRPNIGNGWVNEHFIDDGAQPNQFAPGEPTCGSDVPGASGASGAPNGPGSAPGAPAQPATPVGSSPSNAAARRNPCLSRFPGGRSRTRHITGGSDTLYDQTASLYNVCTGFGTPEGLSLTPTMQCAIIAAAATYVGTPVIRKGVSVGCDSVEVASNLKSGKWIVARNFAISKTCGYFGELFAGAAGVVAAGATSATGPAAAAVGVGTYKALSAGLKLTCGGLFDFASSLGRHLEADHEQHVAMDVLRKGKCLRYRKRFGHVSWAAVGC